MKEKSWNKRIFVVALVIAMVAVCFGTGCGRKASTGAEEKQEEQKPDGIYLYGETHSNEYIQKRELEIWGDFYKEGMRDLFGEYPYYDAKLLNMWMQAEDDEILDMLWKNWSGTNGGEIETYNFFKSIKEKYPETVFHGTDIGHDYRTSGQWYLDYLEEHGQKDSEDYQKTQENMEQGKYYYDHSADPVYRENKMAENFIEEYETMDEAPIMGIYGGAHTDIEGMDELTQTVPCMANQLYEEYGDRLHTTDLSGHSDYGKEKDPIITEEMEVQGKTYQASYFGRFDASFVGEEYEEVDYWRLENAYQDFKEEPLDGEIWDEGYFPMKLKAKQVYMLELIKEDGSVERKYFRTDQNSFKKMGYVKEIVK